MKCVNCGIDLPENSVFCDSCGAQQQPQKPKNKNFTKIGIIAAAAILAICIVATIIVVAFNSNPMTKLMKAVDKTIFDSETIDYEIKVTEYGSSYNRIYSIDGGFLFGDNIDDTEFDANFTYKKSNSTSPSEQTRISLSDGTIRYKEDNYDSESFEILQLLDAVEAEIERSYGSNLDIDLEEFLNNILNNKIDKDAIADYYKDNILPQIEENYNGERDLDEVIDADMLSDLFSRFLELALEEEAIEFKDTKAKSGTSYKYEIDLTKLCRVARDFVDENEDFDEYITIVAETAFEQNADSYREFLDIKDAEGVKKYVINNLKDSLDELIDDIRDEDIEFSGKFTIDGGRLTYFSFNMSGEFLFELTLKSDS